MKLQIGRSNRSRQLARERRLQRTRSARHIERQMHPYSANKPTFYRHEAASNVKFRPAEPRSGRTVLGIPRQMDFTDNMEETIVFLKRLREVIIYSDFSEVMLDHSKTIYVSPESAVCYFAELKRSLAHCHKRKRVRINYPSDPDVAGLLCDIGLYEEFSIRKPSNRVQDAARKFFRVVPGNQTEARMADELIRHLENQVDFPPVARKRLVGALIECMDNVKNHAYRNESVTPEFKGEWWMAGFYDTSLRQVALVFLDQGMGIPTTLREKWTVRIKSLVGLTQARLIRYAVQTGVTRRSSRRHGNGLPSLKGFIDELPEYAGGFLRVVSNRGDYTYCKHASESVTENQVEFDGSLLIWSIHPHQEKVRAGGRIDLSDKNLQTELAL